MFLFQHSGSAVLVRGASQAFAPLQGPFCCHRPCMHRCRFAAGDWDKAVSWVGRGEQGCAVVGYAPKDGVFAVVVARCLLALLQQPAVQFGVLCWANLRCGGLCTCKWGF